ncbi:MAG: hypothetical protein KDD66_17995, partial [Bdellovibrionales bacterium]|nr:hypothetical protein [Bdellovibrionales bacterium]
MHNAAYAHAGLPFTYVAINTENTASVISAVRELGMRGLSLTIPHKEAAVSLVDTCSEEAKAIGAINTVVNDGSSLFGHNTDTYGIRAAFAEAGITLNGKTVLVLGAGGAARAAAAVVSGAGSANCFVSNRSKERAVALASDFSINSLAWDKCKDLVYSESSLVLINATPIGSHLAPQGADFPFELSLVPSSCCVLDMATTPKTALTIACDKAGGIAVSGLRMLLHQAAKQVELFTESAATLSVLEKALYDCLKLPAPGAS